MGSKHANGSQAKLHDTFPGFSKVEATEISAAIQALKVTSAGGPIRVLDIGPGSVPYRSAYEEHRDAIELVFVERIVDLGEGVAAAEYYETLGARFVNHDVFHLLTHRPSTKDDVDRLQQPLEFDDDALSRHLGGGRFDLVIVCAVLHEMYHDVIVVYRQPVDFHARFIAAVRKKLLRPGGRIVIADYAWPSNADAAATWRIKAAQLRVTGHADPPWAFIAPGELQRVCESKRLVQVRSAGRGLYDDVTDATFAAPDGWNLSVHDRDVARLRIGFALTFSAQEQRSEGVERAVIRARTAARLIANDAAGALESSEDAAALYERLNTSFTSGRPELDGRAPLQEITREFRSTVDVELRKLGIPFSGAFETWINIGLKQGRFVPKLQFPSAGTPIPAGLLSVRAEGPRAGCVDHCAEAESALLAGPLAGPFAQFVGNSGVSIHDWARRLNDDLGKRGQLPSADGEKRVRSVTFVMVRTADSESDPEHAASLATTEAWGDEREQDASGHYLKLLYDTPVSEDARALGRRVDEFLRQVGGGVGLYDERTCDEDTDRYEEFLRHVFTVPYAKGKHGARIVPSWDEKFSRSWGTCKPIRYDAYTILLLGCTGVTSATPDTVMIFSEHPFPPSALDTIEGIAEEITSRIGAVEGQVELKRSILRKTEADKLAIVAGTSHAFKNLMTPLVSGLNDLVSHDDPYALMFMKVAAVLPSCRAETLREDIAAKTGVSLHDRGLLWFVLEAMSRLSQYNVIAQRLWRKIFALHISSLKPQEVDVSRWSAPANLLQLIAGSYYCAWYAVTRADENSALRHLKRIAPTSQSVLDLRLSVLGRDVDYRLCTGPNPGGDTIWLRSLADVHAVADREDTAMVTTSIPVVVAEAIAEECFYNALKYGEWERGFKAHLSVTDSDFTITFANVPDARALARPSRAGQGERSLRILAEACGGRFYTVTPEEATSVWRSAVAEKVTRG